MPTQKSRQRPRKKQASTRAQEKEKTMPNGLTNRNPRFPKKEKKLLGKAQSRKAKEKKTNKRSFSRLFSEGPSHLAQKEKPKKEKLPPKKTKNPQPIKPKPPVDTFKGPTVQKLKPGSRRKELGTQKKTKGQATWLTGRSPKEKLPPQPSKIPQPINPRPPAANFRKPIAQKKPKPDTQRQTNNEAHGKTKAPAT
ncbi:hypothetical protein OIU85_014239 [Salix viminalis]|uniref:Uncharacterized protein n=1 Tax=Salix viminalis TaxID=40686 RepID=A0A9Q0NNF2_SALVM|nr:hypothetical protein OIU85_014239 [Salix viminalis]